MTLYAMGGNPVGYSGVGNPERIATGNQQPLVPRGEAHSQCSHLPSTDTGEISLRSVNTGDVHQSFV